MTQLIFKKCPMVKVCKPNFARLKAPAHTDTLLYVPNIVLNQLKKHKQQLVLFMFLRPSCVTQTN